MHKKIMSFSFYRTLTLFLVFCVNNLATAEIYKWVDEQGNTHYTQTPPPEVDDIEKLDLPSPVDTDAANQALEQRNKMLNELREERNEKRELQQNNESEVVKNEQQCEQARKRLASYQRPRVNVKNPDGSQRNLTEEERQAEIQKSKEYIKKACE